jgi:predicted acylesterase/phospholipase RssA
MTILPQFLRIGWLLFASSVVLAAIGCRSSNGPETPTKTGLVPAELIDPKGYGDSPGLPVARDLFRVGERIRIAQKPAELPSKKTCLCLSVGGAFGAFQAGLLVGWTETGTRPEFDSITGVSTGALVAGLAFLGPDFDPELRRVYTTLQTKDIYTKKRTLRGLFSESLADNAPLARLIEGTLTPDVIARMAAEHRKGRRLYIATTDLDGRRPIVWDIGAIADKAEPGSHELIHKLFLASAAIPAFFPPVEVPVEVDGRRYVERHVDGGVTQNVFIRPPQVPKELRLRPPADFLYGSDVYVIVAGKLFGDAENVKPRTLDIANSSISTLTNSETRAELVILYTTCMVAGMNYNLAALPQDFQTPSDAITFEPAVMTKLFEEGRRQALTNTAWRHSPPGTLDGEILTQRAGARLTRQPTASPQPAGAIIP